MRLPQLAFFLTLSEALGRVIRYLLDLNTVREKSRTEACDGMEVRNGGVTRASDLKELHVNGPLSGIDEHSFIGDPSLERGAVR